MAGAGPNRELADPYSWLSRQFHSSGRMLTPESAAPLSGAYLVAKPDLTPTYLAPLLAARLAERTSPSVSCATLGAELESR